MCEASRDGWMFTDAEACVISPGGALMRCTCPISTCVGTPSGFECQLSTASVIAIGAMIFVFLCGLMIHFHASSKLDDLVVHSNKLECGSRDVLFGVYHASDEGQTETTSATTTPPPTERTRINVANDGTQGGTFTS